MSVATHLQLTLTFQNFAVFFVKDEQSPGQRLKTTLFGLQQYDKGPGCTARVPRPQSAFLKGLTAHCQHVKHQKASASPARSNNRRKFDKSFMGLSKCMVLLCPLAWYSAACRI